MTLVLFQSRFYVPCFGTSLLCVVVFFSFLYLDSQGSQWIKHPFSYQPNVTAFISIDGTKHNVTPSKPKHVLFWNRPNYLQKRDLFKGCTYKCILTTDKTKLDNADAVLFHAPHLGGRKPPKKPREQVWVHFGMEAPPSLPSNFDKWRRLVNWTIYYRRDSDIICRYGSFISRDLQATNRNASRIGEMIVHKNRTAVWFVSNCGTSGRREAYVRVLQKHVHVDVYGACGPLKCRVNDGSGTLGITCLQKAEQDTTYYLSFENTLCRDYMTEKAYKVYTTRSLIPVVRGGANYSMYLPPHTFIDASTFKDATALSKYVITMKTNASEFTHLFENRNLHTMVNNDGWGSTPFCEMCRRLYFPDSYRRLYEDISIWFRGTKTSPVCKRPTDLT